MKGRTLGLFLALGVISLFESVQAGKTDKFCQNCCALEYKTHGCFKDTKKDRDLPNLVLYERYDVNWVNWKVYMYDFTCRCAYAARRSGAKFFGIQFWGECWASDKWTEPGLHGKSTNCYGDDHQPCGDRKYCVGKQWTNFIYEIVDLPCKIKMNYKGCWRDRKTRALKNYSLTGRENLPILSTLGRIDWFNYDTYLPQFACECAQKAKDANETIFGLQFWGECWIGNPGDDYTVYGKNKAKCYDNCFGKCGDDSAFCVGQRWSNAVYEIV